MCIHSLVCIVACNVGIFVLREKKLKRRFTTWLSLFVEGDLLKLLFMFVLFGRIFFGYKAIFA